MELFKLDKLYGVITEKNTPHNISGLNNVISSISDIIEYEYFLIGIVFPQSMTKSQTGIVDNYNPEWRDIYDSDNLKSIDPTVLYCMHNHRPALWSDPSITTISKHIKAKTNVLEEAKGYELRNGISIPIHSYRSISGMYSFANSDNHTGLHNLATIASQALSPLVIDCFANDPSFSRSFPSQQTLTPREIECLQWSAEGKSAWEIAKISNCSERTVVFHLTNTCEKLDAQNKYQAITKAIILGIIHPQV